MGLSGKFPQFRSSKQSTFLAIATLLLLIGAFFRAGGLARNNPLHSDEALFANYARLMVLQGDWLLDEVTTDKPPTTYVLVGLSLGIWGENEFAVRLPNFFVSLVGLAVFYTLAKRCSQSKSVALIALLLWVVAPIEIGYAPTAFQDPPMMLFALLAAWMASRQQWGMSGFFLGMAVLMKPTGLWLGPLVVGIGVLREISPLPTSPKHGEGVKISQTKKILHSYRMVIPQIREWGKKGLWFGVWMAVPILVVYGWDQSRTAQSFIELGGYNNNPDRLIRSTEVIPRFEVWVDWLGDFAGREWLGVVFLLAGILWLGVSAYREPSGLMSWWIMVYSLWYMAIYWLVAFNTWDRYVLPIAPFILLVMAQGIVWVTSQGRGMVVIVGIGILAVSWQPAVEAVHRSDQPGINGLTELADTLNREYAGAVVYDPWLGWYLDWYLGGYPQVYTVYFVTPEDLANHLQDVEAVRYFVAPSPEVARSWLALLERKGISSEEVYRTTQNKFVLYRLVTPLVCKDSEQTFELRIWGREVCGGR